MEILSSLVKDLVIIGIIASFCDLLLPRSDVRRPVQLVFGLYFMALMLNPLVAFFQDIDLSSIDFESLATERIIETEQGYSEELIYKEAAETLSDEIEGKISALYHLEQVSVSIQMNNDGFQKVKIKMENSSDFESVYVAEIKDFLAIEYGIPGNVVSVSMGKG